MLGHDTVARITPTESKTWINNVSSLSLCKYAFFVVDNFNVHNVESFNLFLFDNCFFFFLTKSPVKYLKKKPSTGPVSSLEQTEAISIPADRKTAAIIWAHA